jgi:hypothetical protein
LAIRLIYLPLVGIITGCINQSHVKEQMNWFLTIRPYMLASVRPYVLRAEAERALKPLASFREWAAATSPSALAIQSVPSTARYRRGVRDITAQRLQSPAASSILARKP